MFPIRTDEESANVKRALATARIRFGSYTGIAKAIAVTQAAILAVTGNKGRPVPLLIAFNLARKLRVPVEDLLAGKWPAEGACPRCGRVGG